MVKRMLIAVLLTLVSVAAIGPVFAQEETPIKIGLFFRKIDPAAVVLGSDFNEDWNVLAIYQCSYPLGGVRQLYVMNGGHYDPVKLFFLIVNSSGEIEGKVAFLGGLFHGIRDKFPDQFLSTCLP